MSLSVILFFHQNYPAIVIQVIKIIIAQAQAKKLVEWAWSGCTEHGNEGFVRRFCPECWQQLRKEVGL